MTMVRKLLVGSIALIPAAAMSQTGAASAVIDFSTARVAPGAWAYQPQPGGSMARFVDTTGIARLTIQCTRATRRVAIAHTSTAPAASLQVWTSSASRNLPARFEANAMRVTAELPAFDALLDGIAFSRGRIAVRMPGSVPLVAPAWPEAARTIEDCRI